MLHAGVSIGSAANEFYLGFLQSYTPEETQPQLLVSTNENSPVVFTVETASGNFSYSGVVRNGAVSVVTLPWWYQVEITETGITNQGIHVKAEAGKEITVHGLQQPGAGDAYLAFPCSHIPSIAEYEYYAITYHGAEPSDLGGVNYEGSTVLLVGCEDDTTITIDNSATVTLNRLETYLHYEVATRADLTGARYVSNKPISVFSGHPCTFVPSSRRFCDPLIEQIPPTATWGTSFLSKSFEGRTSGEIYRVLAAYPSTVVTVECYTLPTLGTAESSATLTLGTAGSWEEFQTPAYSYCGIESNHPVLAMEFMLGRGNSEINGDPIMMMLPPIDQYSNHYSLRVVPDFEENYITVYVAPQFFQPHSIILDDYSLEEEEWTPVLCSGSGIQQYCGYIASLNVLAGDLELYHEDSNARIGVSVHGLDRFISYGYIGSVQVQTSKLFQDNLKLCAAPLINICGSPR